MKKKEFLEGFYKIYQNPQNEAIVSKIPSVMFLSGENCSISFLTLPIMPDTLIGIRETFDDTIYIREINSEILYSAKKENLKNYDGDEKIKKIFYYLAEIIKNIDFSGCEILIYQNDLIQSQDNIKDGIGLSIYKLAGRKKDFFSFMDEKIEKIEIMKKRATRATSLITEEDKCCYYDEEGKMILPLNVKGTKIVIAKFKYEKNKPYIFKEGYTPKLRDALQKGKIEEFLEIMNRECEEYKNNTPKNSAFRDFYNLCLGKSIARGIYEDKGMFLIIRDENVDEFVKMSGEEYEKLRGERPEFYVLDNSFVD